MRPGFRPATDTEYRDDYAKRVAAIERAEAEGTHSPRQIKDAREVLLTFRGYPRPVEEVGPCTAERPFGWHCTMRCERKAGHDGPHKAQCFTWDDNSWTQADDTGEIVAAVSHAEKIDLTQVYTGPITDKQYVELFLRGEFYIVREDQP